MGSRRGSWAARWGEESRAKVECLEKLRFISSLPLPQAGLQGWVPRYVSLSLRHPPSLLLSSQWHLLVALRVPPPQPLGRWSTTQHMPPRADVRVPGSSLRGSRWVRLMCDETESSEPLGDLGSKVGRAGGDVGYQGKHESQWRRWGGVQWKWDVGIRLIIIWIRGQAQTTELRCCFTGGLKCSGGRWEWSRRKDIKRKRK